MVAFVTGCANDTTSRTDIPAEHVSMMMQIDGHAVRFELEQNTSIRAADYREYEVDRAGIISEHASTAAADCYYRGRPITIDGAPAAAGDVAALSMCGGRIRGLVTLGRVPWAIEPTEARDEVAVARIDQPSAPTTRVRVAVHASAPTVGVAQSALSTPTKFLELVLYNDHARSQSLGNTVTTDALALANIADALYRNGDLTPAIGIVVTAQVTFAQADPFVVADDPSERLINLQTWLASRTDLPTGDETFLLDGIGFTASSVLGYAAVGATCSEYGNGFCVTTGTAAQAGTVIAHELGHALGMNHDSFGNACPQSGFIMAPLIGATPPTHWSTCSQSYLTTFLASVTCLDNAATPSSEHRCGDGAVTGTEQCDCGLSACTDPCCNGATCMFFDADSDGTRDCDDTCPDDPAKTAPGACGCGTADADSDDDGTLDCLDECPLDPAKLAPGICGCGAPDDDPACGTNGGSNGNTNDDDGGCSTGSGGGLSLGLALLALLRRRRLYAFGRKAKRPVQ